MTMNNTTTSQKDIDLYLILIWLVPNVTSIDNALLWPNFVIISSCHSIYIPRVKGEATYVWKLRSISECSW